MDIKEILKSNQFNIRNRKNKNLFLKKYFVFDTGHIACVYDDLSSSIYFNEYNFNKCNIIEFKDPIVIDLPFFETGLYLGVELKIPGGFMKKIKMKKVNSRTTNHKTNQIIYL